MHVRRFVAAAAIAIPALLATAVPAQAAPKAPTTEADIIGVVKIDKHDPTVGQVHVRYRCAGEGGLWVSVKQTADRTADEVLTTHESSQYAAAIAHSHRNPVTCDGQWHTQWFTVDQVEWGFGQLAKGEGYVQFCLFDDAHTAEPYSRNEFVHVR